MKARWLAVLFLLAAVAYGLGIASWASTQDPRTITVQPGESIQQAIDSASEGDTILVQAGTYQEDLLITKPLTLRGEGRAEVALQGSVSILGARLVTVSGFTITGGLGVEVRDSTTITISDNAILGSGAEGPLLSNATATVRRNTISESQGNGIIVTMGSQATISNNIISDNAGAGISLILSSMAAISANVITGNGGAGISISDSTADISGNTIRDNAGCGIQADRGSKVTGADNFIGGNQAGNLCGGVASRGDLSEKTPPPVPENLRVDPSDWTNGPITVDWDNPEDPSGIAAFWYKIGAKPTGPEDGARREIDEKPLVLESPPEGEQPIYLWLEDGAGNKSHRNRAQATLRSDRTPPTGSLIINEGAEGTYWLTVTLRIEARDELSGLAEMRFSNDGRTWSEWEPFAETKQWDLSAYGGSEEEGTKTVWAQVKDKAGNISRPFSDRIFLHPACHPRPGGLFDHPRGHRCGSLGV